MDLEESQFFDYLANASTLPCLGGSRCLSSSPVPPGVRSSPDIRRVPAPILRGDRLLGRIEPVFERRSGVLRVPNVFWEAGVEPVALDRPVRSLAASSAPPASSRHPRV